MPHKVDTRTPLMVAESQRVLSGTRGSESWVHGRRPPSLWAKLWIKWATISLQSPSPPLSHGFPEPFLQWKSNKGCSESGLSLWPQPTDQSVGESSPLVLSAPFSLGRAAKYAGMERAVASVGGSYIKSWLFHNEPYEGASTLGILILLPPKWE